MSLVAVSRPSKHQQFVATSLNHWAMIGESRQLVTDEPVEFEK